MMFWLSEDNECGAVRFNADSSGSIQICGTMVWFIVGHIMSPDSVIYNWHQIKFRCNACGLQLSAYINSCNTRNFSDFVV